MNTRKGFTLVELLVVIAILAILATVSVVGYTSFIANAENSVALAEVTQVRDYVIANEYIAEDVTVDTSLVNTTLGLKGTISASQTINRNEWYSYTTESTKGVAYWNRTTGEVTTTKPTGWK